MRAYAVSTNAPVELIGLGDCYFDKALFVREKATRNGRCSAYDRALRELNAAISAYAAPRMALARPLPRLSALLRKSPKKSRK